MRLYSQLASNVLTSHAQDIVSEKLSDVQTAHSKVDTRMLSIGESVNLSLASLLPQCVRIDSKCAPVYCQHGELSSPGSQVFENTGKHPEFVCESKRAVI